MLQNDHISPVQQHAVELCQLDIELVIFWRLGLTQ